MTTEPTRASQAGFGIDGLDDILAGGLERDRLYLLEGNPGTGKTTAAMSFLTGAMLMGGRSCRAKPLVAGYGLLSSLVGQRIVDGSRPNRWHVPGTMLCRTISCHAPVCKRRDRPDVSLTLLPE